MKPARFTCIVALAVAASAGQVAAADYVGEISVITDMPNTPDVSDWRARLNKEVAKLVQAGHMAPLRVQVGETESYFYFADPFELVLTLSRARSYLDDELTKKAVSYTHLTLPTN